MSNFFPSKQTVLALQNRLLRWFAHYHRPLPWRKRPNPYRIFVVEVMLQQTQIKTVIPYYRRWLKKFPTVRSLARARLDRVLKLWEGLGYYTRARNLHKAAQMIARRFSGKIPSDPEILQTLPGIGPYTAGAIASIAYQKPVPLVDGNVERVLARLFNIKKDVTKPAVRKEFYKIAAHLIPPKAPGIFNQALMELGSLVCVPLSPNCGICPVRALCKSRREGNPSLLPVKPKRLEIKKIKMAVGILERDGRILIRRRPERGIWGGLWELPGTVAANGASLEESLREEFQSAFGLAVRISTKLKPIEHRFTHRRALIQAFRLRLNRRPRPRIQARGIRWAKEADLKRYSFPVPHRKILNEEKKKIEAGNRNRKQESSSRKQEIRNAR